MAAKAKKSVAKRKNGKNTYVVVKRGMHKGTGLRRTELEVGSELELTEVQAAARVGKVMLKSEYGKAGVTPSVELKAARKEIAALTAENETLKTQLEAAIAGAGKGDPGGGDGK